MEKPAFHQRPLACLSESTLGRFRTVKQLALTVRHPPENPCEGFLSVCLHIAAPYLTPLTIREMAGASPFLNGKAFATHHRA